MSSIGRPAAAQHRPCVPCSVAVTRREVWRELEGPRRPRVTVTQPGPANGRTARPTSSLNHESSPGCQVGPETPSPDSRRSLFERLPGVPQEQAYVSDEIDAIPIRLNPYKGG